MPSALSDYIGMEVLAIWIYFLSLFFEGDDLLPILITSFLPFHFSVFLIALDHNQYNNKKRKKSSFIHFNNFADLNIDK